MIIQKLVFPPIKSDFPQDMFFRGKAICEASTGKLHLAKGEGASFDTFYNAVSINVWRGDCDLENVRFSLAGRGDVLVKYGLHRNGKSQIWLGEERFSLSETPVSHYLSFWKELTEGLLFVRIEAISDVSVWEGAFETDEPVLNVVKLGLVITHFNRQKQALSSANMLSREVLAKAGGAIELAIVDNSQNFPADYLKDGEYVSVIKNRNCGGSGGFTRGLLHFKDNGFTHCLFMDDDASCLPESIWRAWTYFSLCKRNEKIGLSGILLKDTAPNIVHECGAKWQNGNWNPICQGVNLEKIGDLLLVNKYRSEANYGAWCFFGFKIDNVNKFPFPFFVRGDDTLFSLCNNFTILTIPGVATRIDSFLNKESPTTRYLAFRSLLVISEYMHEATPMLWWRRFKGWNNFCAFSYAYGQSDGTAMALDDVLRRQHLFDGDIDGSRFRKELSTFKQPNQPFDGETSRMQMRNFSQESVLHKVIRKLTVNGLLIPTFFFKGEIFFPKSEWVNFRQIYRFKKICYYNDENSTVFVAEHNKKEIIKRLWMDAFAAFLILINFKSAQKRIQRDLTELTTEDFWRKALSQDVNKS